MNTRSEAEREAHEDRGGIGSTLLLCQECANVWSVATRWGEIINSRKCPECGAQGVEA